MASPPLDQVELAAYRPSGGGMLGDSITGGDRSLRLRSTVKGQSMQYNLYNYQSNTHYTTSSSTSLYTILVVFLPSFNNIYTLPQLVLHKIVLGKILDIGGLCPLFSWILPEACWSSWKMPASSCIPPFRQRQARWVCHRGWLLAMLTFDSERAIRLTYRLIWGKLLTALTFDSKSAIRLTFRLI